MPEAGKVRIYLFVSTRHAEAISEDELLRRQPRCGLEKRG